MAVAIETLRGEHRRLRREVDAMREAARELPELSPVERAELRDWIVSFLNEVLIPFAEAEEQGLYAGVAELLGDERSIAPMIYDHRAICERAVELASTPVTDVARLQELMYGLHALIEVHFRKEEELYLPLAELAWMTGPSRT